MHTISIHASIECVYHRHERSYAFQKANGIMCYVDEVFVLRVCLSDVQKSKRQET